MAAFSEQERGAFQIPWEDIQHRGLEEQEMNAIRRIVWPVVEEIDDVYSLWYNQELLFVENDSTDCKAQPMRSSFLQPKNGPCGILAGIQANLYLIQLQKLWDYQTAKRRGKVSTKQHDADVIAPPVTWELPVPVQHIPFLDAREAELIRNVFSPNNEERLKSLGKALAAILSRVQMGGHDAKPFCVHVVLPRSLMPDAPEAKTLPSALSELFCNHELYHVHTVSTRRALNRFMCQHVAQFLPKGGIIYFMYSIVLSRGVRQIYLEMEKWGSLVVDKFGFCGQPLVNLLTTGESIYDVSGKTERIVADASLPEEGLFRKPDKAVSSSILEVNSAADQAAASMTEEEMIALAIQQSVQKGDKASQPEASQAPSESQPTGGNTHGNQEVNPDDLTEEQMIALALEQSTQLVPKKENSSTTARDTSENTTSPAVAADSSSEPQITSTSNSSVSVSQMSEEEQLRLALERSLHGGGNEVPGPTRKVIELITRAEYEGKYLYEVLCEASDTGLLDGTVPPPRKGLKWRCRRCFVKSPRVWKAWFEDGVQVCTECETHYRDAGRTYWVTFQELPEKYKKEAKSRYPDADKLPVVKDKIPESGDHTVRVSLKAAHVGFLTRHTHVGKHLKLPRHPIWVIHGGSHYTVLFALDAELVLDEKERRSRKRLRAIDISQGESFDFYHFNGLPPAGPKLSFFTGSIPPEKKNTESQSNNSTSSDRPKGPSGKAMTEEEMMQLAIQQSIAGASGSGKSEEVDYDPQTILPGWGRVMEIVTRRKNGNHWEYECACLWIGGAKDDANHVMEVPLPTERWRCRNCTLQTPTVWSAINDKDTLICNECLKPLQECGRCVWVKYEDLPPAFVEQVDNQYSPEIQKVLRTAYPSIRIKLPTADELPL